MNSNHQLRDLVWAVGSRPLIVDCPIIASHDPRKAESPPFDSTQVDPDHLAEFLQESSGRRVGRYFERLILFWLKHIRRVEVVAESLQIRDGNRTIGEIDLLFYDERRRLTHWEIAVKFYLHFHHPNPIGSQYIGPNAADTFERKMERLFEHQLPRSESHFPDVTLREAFVKGRIFYHPQHGPPESLPTHLAPDHLRGLWIRSSEIDQISGSSDASYRILEKPFWLAEETADSADNDLLSPVELPEALAQHFFESDRPVLISQLAPDQSSLVESQRIFVVSENWPDVRTSGASPTLKTRRK